MAIQEWSREIDLDATCAGLKECPTSNFKELLQQVAGPRPLAQETWEKKHGFVDELIVENPLEGTDLGSAGIYIGIGWSGQYASALYVGKAINITSRVASHMREEALVRIAEDEGAPLHNQAFAGCDRVHYFPAIELPKDLDRQQIDDLLAVGEWLVCWMLGSYQLSGPLQIARAKFGLPALCVDGVNATPCLEGPDNRRQETCTEPLGPLDETILSLKRRLAAVLAIERQAIAAGKASPVKESAKAAVRDEIRAQTGRLLCTGKYLVRYNAVEREAQWILLDWPLWDATIQSLKALYGQGDRKPVCAFRLREAAPSPDTDLVLAGPEAQMARCRGVVLIIGVVGAAVAEGADP
ncbi:unnamed protein product [Parajaminaea phylloscopi]